MQCPQPLGDHCRGTKSGSKGCGVSQSCPDLPVGGTTPSAVVGSNGWGVSQAFDGCFVAGLTCTDLAGTAPARIAFKGPVGDLLVTAFVG